ncbi:MAG: carbamoyltransferase HypF [Fibrobacterota bacterium]
MNGKKVTVKGTVQGVGFRPYIYNLALEYGINGDVMNTPDGVVICASGENLEEFIRLIPQKAPPLAGITSLESEPTENPHEGFYIRPSSRTGKNKAVITTDSRVCDKCLKEFFDPLNRRYLYPFINCTDCGPRYTLIRDLPYDRPLTSMGSFYMCAECQKEYDDPCSRRFHAQPNCCPECGPVYNDADKAVTVIENGGIVAIKGIGGYHLCCDADNEKAVYKLREFKKRNSKPFAVMVPDIENIILSKDEKAVMEGPERPILLVNSEDIPPGVAPGLNTLGIMLPYAPIHYLLFLKGKFRMLVMTSGNMNDEPMRISGGDVFLDNPADFILDHNRDIVVRNDDSIVRMIGKSPVILRRGRGYSPQSIFILNDADGYLGTGSILKNTVTLGRGRELIMSQHIGDLTTVETLEAAENAVSHLYKALGTGVTRIAADMHPDFPIENFTGKNDSPVVRIQHHAAHAYSCMAEHGLKSCVAAVFDGVGYGPDGNSWGSEFLAIDGSVVQRMGHAEYFRLPGGDACVREPLRTALSIMYPNNAGYEGMENILAMLSSDSPMPLSCGMGRIFDAAAALTGICRYQTYEGQAPMMFEAAADRTVKDRYHASVLSPGLLLREMSADDSDIQVKSAKFHNTVISDTADMLTKLHTETGIKNICLTGGCFQNKIITEGLIKSLKGIADIYTHRRIPPNDGGIASGQVYAMSLNHTGEIKY